MNSLTHEQAREYMQQGYHHDLEALRQHLVTCEECRTYASVHAQLLRELPVRDSRAHPTIEQHAAILAAAGGGVKLPRFWRPLAAVGGLAAILFLATAFWLVLSVVANPDASRPRLPAPWATLLAPILPQPTAQATQPAPTPTPASTPDPRGRYRIDTVPAPALAGNLIGEALEQQVAIYLPPSYDTSDKRYPVVYAMIIGHSGRSQADEMNQLGIEARSAMNLALRSGVQEMIVVAIDSANAINLPNRFLNSQVTGNWEDYITNDLVSYIDNNYRTLPSAESRGIYAEAQHGIGGLLLMAHHSDMFGSVYLNRPSLVTPEMAGGVEEHFMSELARSQVLDFLSDARAWPADTAVAQLADKFSETRGLTTIVYETVSFGIDFAPNAQSGVPFFDYPYSTPDGSPDPAIMQKWRNGSGDLRELLQPFADNLKGKTFSILYHDEGDTGSLQLLETFAALGIPYDARASLEELRTEFYQDALPLFSESLTFE
jgi:hypothetical protein